METGKLNVGCECGTNERLADSVDRPNLFWQLVNKRIQKVWVCDLM